MNVVKKIFFMGCLFAGCNLSAMNVNSGYIASYNNTVSTWYYINNGTVIGLNSVTLNVKSLSGSGTISAPTITISCDEFDFTGTISCDGSCRIYTKKAFNPSIFTKEGKGSFTIVISSSAVERHSSSTLLAKACGLMLKNPVSLTDELIDKNISEIRRDAYLNSIDEQDFRASFQKELQKQIAYHAERLDQERDVIELHKGLKIAGVGFGGVLLAGLGYTYRVKTADFVRTYMPSFDNDVVTVVSGGLGVLSLIPLGLSVEKFRKGLNPRHKENYERLLVLQAKIAQAFTQAYVSQDQVIKLS